jgi:hypothetical protein
MQACNAMQISNVLSWCWGMLACSAYLSLLSGGQLWQMKYEFVVLLIYMKKCQSLWMLQQLIVTLAIAIN